MSPAGSEPKYAAVLAAGGSGTRLGASSGGKPKQFMELAGRPIFLWSLEVLLQDPRIAHVVIVAPPHMVPTVRDVLGALERISVVPGGDTRQKSVYLGLQALNSVAPDFVLIHDAARPFLTSEIVNRVIDGVTKHGAITTGMPPADTIKKIGDDFIEDTIPRETLLLVQTPQASRYEWLMKAHDLAASNDHATTDDAAVLEFAGHKVAIARGAGFNIKITHPDDLILAEALASIVFKDRL